MSRKRLSTQLKSELEAIQILLQDAEAILAKSEEQEQEPLWKLNID